MSQIDYSKYTFVSDTLDCLKKSSLAIHVVPTMAEYNKKWHTRSITSPFQFSRKWSDMLDDEDTDDDEDDNDNDNEYDINDYNLDYYKSFLVGSSHSKLPLSKSKTLALHPLSIPNSCSSIQKSDENKLTLYKESLSSIDNQKNHIPLNMNTPDKVFYNSEILPTSEKSSKIDNSSYINIDHTPECVSNLNSDLNFSKYLNCNKSEEKKSNNQVNERNHSEKNKNKTSNLISCKNFLSYTNEVSEKKLIPVSEKQLDQIFSTIKTTHNFQKPLKNTPIQLDQISFGQLQPKDLFKLPLSNFPSVVNKASIDAKDSKKNRLIIEKKNGKEIEQNRSSSNSKENSKLSSNQMSYSSPESKGLSPLSLAKDTRINSSENKFVQINKNNTSSEKNTNSFTGLSSSTQPCVSNDNSDTLSTISELSQPGENSCFSCFENVQIWHAGITHQPLNQVLYENGIFQLYKDLTQDTFSNLLTDGGKFNSHNVKKQSNKLNKQILEVRNNVLEVRNTILDNCLNTVSAHDSLFLSDIEKRKKLRFKNSELIGRDSLRFSSDFGFSSENFEGISKKMLKESNLQTSRPKIKGNVGFTKSISFQNENEIKNMQNKVLNTKDQENLENKKQFFNHINLNCDARKLRNLEVISDPFENHGHYKLNKVYLRVPSLISKLINKAHSEMVCTLSDNYVIDSSAIDLFSYDRSINLVQRLADIRNRSVYYSSDLQNDSNVNMNSRDDSTSNDVNKNPYPSQNQLTTMSIPSTMAKILQRDNKNPNGSGSGSDGDQNGTIPDELKDIYGCCCCYWARIAQPSSQPFLSISQKKNDTNNNKPVQASSTKTKTTKNINKVTINKAATKLSMASRDINGSNLSTNDDRNNSLVRLNDGNNSLVRLNDTNNTKKPTINKISMGTIWSSAVLGFQNLTYNVIIAHFPVFTKSRFQEYDQE